MKKFLSASIIVIALLKNSPAQVTELTSTYVPHKTVAIMRPLVWKENGTGIGNEWIQFSKEFSNALNGRQPLMDISPVCGSEGMYITEVTDKGFIVKKGNKVKAENQFRFTWQAELPAEQND